MFENLTVNDFLQTLQFESLKKLHTEAITQCNVIAYYTTAAEIRRRKKGIILPDLVKEVLEGGFILSYDSAIAEAIEILMLDLTMVSPYAILLWTQLSENAGRSAYLDRAIYDEVIREKEAWAFNTFCSSLTPYEVATADRCVFELLSEYFLRVCEPDIYMITGDGSKEKAERTYRSIENVARHLSRQIEQIAQDVTLVNKMDPQIVSFFKIDEAMKKYRN